MLGIFCNTLTASDNYPVQDSENLSSRIQIELYLKPPTVSNFFVSFLELTSNSKRFGKKDDRHTYFISEIKECEKRG